MSRRIRVNLTRWVCDQIGHDWVAFTDWLGKRAIHVCDRCGRVW